MLRSTRRQLAKMARHWEPTWRFLLNRRAVLAHVEHRPELDEESGRVVADLVQHGIARTSHRRVLESPVSFDELLRGVEDLEQQLDPPLEELRTQAGRGGSPAEKRFLHMYLGERPTLEPESVFARYALQSAFARIADSYFGMRTQLRYYNVWRAFVTDQPRAASQLWHRDREDYLLLKVFVYLDDVGGDSGPFTYAPGTHPRGAVRSKPEFFVEGGVERSSDDQMARVVPRDRWVTAVGKKGDIVFADTRGYHCGGHARGAERLLFTFMYTSPACQRHYFEDLGTQGMPIDPEVSRRLGLSPD